MSIPIVTIYVEYSNINSTVPGTRESEPAPEPSWNPWFVVRNAVQKTDPERNLSFGPAPEPSRNPWFGTCPGTFLEPVVRNVVRNLPRNLSFRTCPGTFPEPVIRNLPRNLPGTCPGSRPGTAPDPILAKTP